MTTAQCSYAPSLILTQNEATAGQATWTFHLVKSADSTDATALVPVMTISKAGAPFAAPNAGTTITELTNGWYKVVHNPADLDTLGCLGVRIAVATADTINVCHQVSAFDTNVATAVLADASLTAAKFANDALSAISTPIRPITQTWSFTANGNQAISMRSCQDAVFVVSGGFGGGSLQAQTCEDASAPVPLWTNSGAAITAAGTITVAGPHNNVRLVLTGATTPTIQSTLTLRKFTVVGG